MNTQASAVQAGRRVACRPQTAAQHRRRIGCPNPLRVLLVPLAAPWLIAIHVHIWSDDPNAPRLNGLLITGPSVKRTALLASMTAYALARLRAPTKAVAFGGNGPAGVIT